jgi:hypothetical protein
MTKEAIKEKIKNVLDSYRIRAINQDCAVEYITNIVIEGAKALSNSEEERQEQVNGAKQETDNNEPSNIIHLENGYKVHLKGYFSSITIDEVH